MFYRLFLIIVLPLFAAMSGTEGVGKHDSAALMYKSYPLQESQVYYKEILRPQTHRRLMTCYYIPAPLVRGDIPLLSRTGRELARVTAASRRRLNMEGTAFLYDGRLINVAGRVGGTIRYVIVNQRTHPYGKGIRNQPLAPWVSIAVNKGQLRQHRLFKRNIKVLSLVGFKTPCNKVLDGVFTIHDTGGGMNPCPFEGGICRTPRSNRFQAHGQIDVFVRDVRTFRQVRNMCYNLVDVFIYPKNLTSAWGRREALNLLIDARLPLNDIYDEDFTEAVLKLQTRIGIPTTGVWDSATSQAIHFFLSS